jgi:hypothetical protein
MTTTLGVCPHDVMKDPEKWASFAHEMRARCGLDCSFTPEKCFEKFAEGFAGYSLAYAHPLHAVRLWREHGFTPLAAYHETFDEAVLIASKRVADPSPQAMSAAKVSCIYGSPSHAAYLLDLRKHALPDPTQWAPKTCYPDVVMAVAQGEASYGVVLKSVWDTMMTLRDRVRPFYATAVKELVHVFMAAPSLRGREGELRDALTGMHRDDRGAAVLHRLGCDALVPFDERALIQIRDALDRCGLSAAA